MYVGSMANDPDRDQHFHDAVNRLIDWMQWMGKTCYDPPHKKIRRK